MKSPITIDFVNATITVNAAYAKKASKNQKMSEERKRKKKKGKDDESILENEIFHIMEVSLKEALDMALDDILKEWK